MINTNFLTKCINSLVLAYDLLAKQNEVKRWFEYRDSRNQTAHNYGEKLANKTINLVPQFIIDSQSLVKNIKK